MALIETWLNCDTTKLVTVKALDGNVFSADNEGNLLGVHVSKKGQPVELSGSVIGYVIRPDGGTVTVPGLLSGNRAWIVLPQSAYAVIGQISIAIRLVDGSEKTVLAACTGYVNRTTTDTIIDPGHVIPSLEELLAQIEACETATTAATAAAGAANTAASNADAKATLANTAAGNADAKATLANTAAGRADDAAAALENMTGTATGLATGEDPTVNITKEDGHYTIEIGVPKGDTGEVSQAEFDALAEEVDQKAPAVFKTIESTPIATFADGADDMPLKDLQVAIEPVQDLHGYDHPWPAGGGKNKWPLGDITEAQTGISVSFPAGTYVMSGVGTNNANIRFYYADETSTLVTSAVGKSFVLTADCVSINIALTGTGDITNVQLEAGTTPTAYEPYSNICPISGWTGVNVTRTGVNLSPESEVKLGGSNPRTYSYFTDSNLPAGTYTMSFTKTGTAQSIDNTGTIQVVFTDGDYKTVGRTSPSTFTADKDIRRIYCYMSTSDYDNGYEITFSNIQLESGSTASAFEPYRGNTYQITFPSEAGTVYGGTLTLNPDRTGTLVVEDAAVDIGTLSWSKRSPEDPSSMVYRGALASRKIGSNRDGIKGQCSQYSFFGNASLDPLTNHIPNGYFGFQSTNSGIVFRDDRYSTEEDFKEAVRGVILVYPLSAPIVYTLTESEIGGILSTLYRQNNVWADTGDINLLTYPVDTAIKVENVDKRITSVLSAIVAPVLTDMIADTALAVNQFRIVNDTLYKVTAPIASGGMLTPGTNVIATSIGEQITALLNA